MQQVAILEAFTNLPDPRRKAGQRHSVSLCLALFTLAIAAGNRGFLAIGDWIEVYQYELIELLGVDKKRLPSYSTIRRVLMQLDYQKYAQCIADFCGLPPRTAKRLTAIHRQILQDDWSEARGYSHPEPHFAIRLVNAYLRELGLILDDPKGDLFYERTGLPEFIRTLALKGVSFALDVIDTHPKLAAGDEERITG